MGDRDQSGRGDAQNRPTIGAMMLLIAGVGVGLAVMIPLDGPGAEEWNEWVFVLAGGVLGGASFVGVPLLIRERWRRPRRRFGPGQVIWFSQGTAAWLLWPPIVVGSISVNRGRNPPIVDPSAPQICFAYGTPLMAVYLTVALLAGGWWRPRVRRRGGRRPRPVPWTERFGLLLGMGWAVLGLYVLSMIYRSKFR
ncbi:hypothetical protein [Tautonia plasticadhaerens]|uniref:Uncharacterized protein n=1 Tax=Tautonia plasticadhaerens TaxID=2527974 RepID=A0A518H702_9BACT|nr:hypothetical protein [Tautonia plasticadhaerens]QDV36628.1 hypothetical protein ElP_45560 [Tautonia plasticadhaerens]